MSSGFLNPVPSKAGNVRDHLYQTFLQSLLDGNGTAFTQDTDSIVYAQAIADSRTISNGWMEAQRIAYAADPNNMTEPFLSRWEVILGLSGYGLTDFQRRQQVKFKMSMRTRVPNYSGLYDLLTLIIPNIFVDLFNYDHTQVISNISGGLTIPGWQVLEDAPYSSNIHAAYIQVEIPTNMKEGDFQKEVSNLDIFLPNFLSSWTTWNWFVIPESRGVQGFFLDERNLSYESFGTG